MPTKKTTNTGLCKLVAPSVVATAISTSMTFPTTLTRGATTECGYRAKDGGSQTILISFDTQANSSTFASSRVVFERRGLKLGQITNLGDAAYYFGDQSGQSTVTTVVLLKGMLQILTTGTGTLDQIGAIARYAMDQYGATASPQSGAG